MKTTKQMRLKGFLMSIMLLVFCLPTWADEIISTDIKLISNRNITGDATQKNIATAAPLLYGMPFELTLDVDVPEASAESAPSFNQWGSEILNTGLQNFQTIAGAIQIYQRSKTNGGILVIVANGTTFTFSNVTYSTKHFNVHLVQSNGQFMMEVASYANDEKTLKNPATIFTKPMMFNRIEKLLYAMPVGMNISNFSLTVRTEDIKNYIRNILPKGVGYLTEEARTYVCDHIDGDNSLNVYREFVDATSIQSNGDFGLIASKRAYQLPEIGKAYLLRGVCQDNTYYLKRSDAAGTNNFELTAEAPNPANFETFFQYLWSPRYKSESSAEDKMALYHATGLGQYLARNGVSAERTSLSSAPEWTVSNGTEQGRIALYGQFANGNRYMAMSRQGNKIGDWPTNGGVYIKRQNDNNWSTDFVFEEVNMFSAYELEVTGPAGFDPSVVTVRYRQKIDGTENHYTGENEGIVADITAGGIVFISKAYEESTTKCRLSVSDFTPSEVSGYVAIVTLGSGVINVEYTQFETLKGKAQAEINSAQARLNVFAEGSLFTQEAIDAANAGIAASAQLYAESKPKEACQKLETTMETFFMTIDGRYIIAENGSGENEKFISTSSATNLVARKKMTDATGNYFGVYQLHHVSAGAYQLRNAFENNYIGQTTTDVNVNSTSSTVASRWRGSYKFNLIMEGAQEDAYNLVCTNGVEGTMLGLDGERIKKVVIDESLKEASANLWDIRLVDVKTYANAYKDAASGVADNIGFAPSKLVKDELDAAISACPNRVGNEPTAEQETALAGELNHYVLHKDDINKPTNGALVTFTNRSTNKLIGENLYEMKVAESADLGCVWETVVDGDKYYFKNVKTGAFMGKVTQSAVGRLTLKNDGENRQEIDVVAAPNREPSQGFVALHEKGTNSSYSYLHHAANDRNHIVGWANNTEASHWTITEVADDDLINYLKAATTDVQTTLATDIAAYNDLGDNPGNYEKSAEVIGDANTAANKTWPANPTKDEAFAAYNAAKSVFKTFTEAGTPITNNEMFLIKTSIELTDQQGQNPVKYFVTQVLNDNTEGEGGSLTNGIVQSAGENFYLFTLWQLVKAGEYYKLYNFYTGYYLSKEISLSNNHNNRYALTTNPDEAATFIITPQHGCFVSFQLSDMEELNSGFLNMITTSPGSRTMFGLADGNITIANNSRMLFELEPATTEHYEKCLTALLDYQIGDGIGEYTDVSGRYETERDVVAEILSKKDELPEAEYKARLQQAAKDFAPILAGLRINLPQAGTYYRIYSQVTTGANENKVVTRYYLNSANPNNNALMVENQGGAFVKDDTKSVFYYDGSHLLGYDKGYYIGNGGTPWAMGEVGQNYEFDFANTGYLNKGCYSIRPRGRSYLYNNISQLNGWSSAFNERCEWYLEEVTELPAVVNELITETGSGFTTLVSPRRLAIPADMECYIAVVDETDNTAAKFTKLEDEIPAYEPVLIKVEAEGTHHLEVLDNVADDAGSIDEATAKSGNLLSGAIQAEQSYYVPGSTDYLQYTLQVKDEKFDFFGFTGTTLPGFRAYISKDKKLDTSKFFEGDIPTGIGLIQVNKNYDGIYDLFGRKIKSTNIGSGFFIINGEKVFIKK